MDSSLNLYAEIEHLLGVSDVAPTLYRNYLNTLRELQFDSLLDVGCGRGEFLAQFRVYIQIEN